MTSFKWPGGKEPRTVMTLKFDCNYIRCFFELAHLLCQAVRVLTVFVSCWLAIVVGRVWWLRDDSGATGSPTRDRGECRDASLTRRVTLVRADKMLMNSRRQWLVESASCTLTMAYQVTRRVSEVSKEMPRLRVGSPRCRDKS